MYVISLTFNGNNVPLYFFKSIHIMTINIQCKIINEIPILALYSNYKEGLITFDELKEQGKKFGAVITAS